ncbi:MAG: 30S ribosome-binding factor RbfA [Gammaproteobacteria bacterium]|nr:30S ribosome-binding factor RbfA [Gammaproteobacteria bacterium]
MSSQLHRELTNLVRYSLKDPRIGAPSILEVKVSRDLSVAKVYFGLLDAENSKETEKALNKSAGFLHRELGKMLNVRIIPSLRFYYDDTDLKAQQMDALINEAMKNINPENEIEE